MAIYGYRRVSTVEQASEGRSSLDDQARRIEGAAMVRGEAITETFTDPGVSGSVPLFRRPAGAKLYAVLKPGDVIIASKMDRIFRSTSDAVNTVELLQKRGIHMILVDIGTDYVTDGGVAKLFFSIFAAVAEFERHRITERNVEGRKGKKARNGFIGGQAPYGFKVYGKGSNAVLVEDPAEMGVVALIRELSVDGSLRDIGRGLDRRGICNRDGARFHPTTISRILKRSGQAG